VPYCPHSSRAVPPGWSLHHWKEDFSNGAKGIAVSQGIVISASLLGKYKTVLEVASISFLILSGDIFSIDLHQVGMGLLWVAMALAVISGVDYFKKFLKSIIL
jgi:CDP-diacylglycerol--glycerol-3-phosphate 3-phosphatidyltransferase